MKLDLSNLIDAKGDPFADSAARVPDRPAIFHGLIVYRKIRVPVGGIVGSECVLECPLYDRDFRKCGNRI